VPLGGGLCAHPHPKVRLFGLPVVPKLVQFDSFSVDDLDRPRGHLMRFPRQLRYFLYGGRLELLRDVDVPERVLTQQVVNREPLDVCDFFVVRERQGEVFLQVSPQNIGPEGGNCTGVVAVKWQTYFPYSSGTMKPWGPGRLAAPAQKNVSAPLPS
jgi:hypothetical protein